MMESYNQAKQELTQLLSLVRDGIATFEDAAAKLKETRQRLNEPTDIQREKAIAELAARRYELVNLINGYRDGEDRKAIEIIAKEKTQGFPWLSQAYADYFYLQDIKLADYLETKPHPALETSSEIRSEIAAKRRIAERLYRVLKYKLEYYERLFPWLVDFGEEGIDDLIRQTIEKMQKGGKEIEEPDDAAKKYLTEVEYGKLPVAEKYQLALDRYWKKKKTKWEIGRDYERYIGYTYESKDWAVHYHGIVEGFADLGRDLICVKKDYAEIVQCKCWAKEYETGKPKEIHEKHVFQLFGTITAFIIDNPDKKVSGKFVTSTFLSDRAWQFAKALGIKVLEDYPLEHYPCIKCNVSRRDGTKIYHLPFDQQYDSTIIEEERNECYVETVEQAEDLGFRRAFRWRGQLDEPTNLQH